MSKLLQELQVKAGKRFRIATIDPDATPDCKTKEAAQTRLKKNLDRLAVLQYLLYAEGKRSVLMVLQGIDAGGKDGTVRNVMSGLNPQGVRVTSFKVPDGEEKRHDYLWRVHKATPQQGEIGLFNRSHYEDVLVVRVHDLVPKAVWQKRYEQINYFEKMLAESGTTIVKFFLSISKDEQKRRFEERLKDKTKNWKFSPGDIEERKYWDEYEAAFEDAIAKCNAPWAPWYVIPANKKWYRNLAVSEILVKTMERMKLQYPEPAADLSKIQFE